MIILRTTMIAAAVLTVAACGSDDPYCGDGTMDPGEQCDDGNDDETDVCLSTCIARQRPSLTVKWAFNADAAPGFTGDSCTDMEADRVRIELIGGPEELVLEEKCSFRQVVFFDVPVANYSIRISALEVTVDEETELETETLLTSAPVDTAYEFLGGNVTTDVVVPPESWTRTYDGTFIFRTAWSGVDCQIAVPAVAEQKLTLVAGGETFVGQTEDGLMLDGTLASECIPLAEDFPQSALKVPFGPATLTVEGFDSEGIAVYETVYETFVGAGLFNPELVFDVEKIAL